MSSSGNPDGRRSRHPHHGRRPSYDASGRPIQYDANGHPIQYDANGRLVQSSGGRSNPYPTQSQHHSPSVSPSYTLRPEHRHHSMQGYSEQQPLPQNYYAGYNGPMQNGHPIVPSQHGAQHYAVSAGMPAVSYPDPGLARYPAQDYHAHQQQAMAQPPSPQDNQIICSECNQTFTRKHDKKRHIDSHHREASYPCPHCEKTYARMDSLRRHINSPCPGLPRGGGSSSGSSGGAAGGIAAA